MIIQKWLKGAISSFQIMYTNVKDFTSCSCDVLMMNCLYFLSKKKSSFIIYSLVLLTSLLSIFNKFGRKKRQLQREDTQMKRENIKKTTPTWIIRSSKH
jgi:hypothetical protein